MGIKSKLMLFHTPLNNIHFIMSLMLTGCRSEFTYIIVYQQNKYKNLDLCCDLNLQCISLAVLVKYSSQEGS